MRKHSLIDGGKGRTSSSTCIPHVPCVFLVNDVVNYDHDDDGDDDGDDDDYDYSYGD